MGMKDDLVGTWGDGCVEEVRLHTTDHGKFHSLIGGVQAFGGNLRVGHIVASHILMPFCWWAEESKSRAFSLGRIGCIHDTTW